MEEKSASDGLGRKKGTKNVKAIQRFAVMVI